MYIDRDGNQVETLNISDLERGMFCEYCDRYDYETGRHIDCSRLQCMNAYQSYWDILKVRWVSESPKVHKEDEEVFR